MKFIVSLVVALSAVSIPVALAQTKASRSSSYSIQTPSRKYDFALVSSNGESVSCWGRWNSNEFDSLKERAKGDTLFVKKGGDMYAITDAGVVREAKKAIEPMVKLGKEQGTLGRKQGDLGRQQGELGRRQGDFGRSMGESAKGIGSDRQSQEKYRAEMKSLGEQMKKLGEQQKELGEKQKALGAQQRELGKKQGEAAREADEKITKLIDNAFERGLAKKV